MNLGKLVAKLALGIGLAVVPVVYGCGDEGDTEEEITYCSVDSQCKGDRICLDGVCQGGDGNGENYTCETACGKMKYCCTQGEKNCYDEDSGLSKWGDSYCFQNYGESCMDNCLKECLGEPWPQKMIGCATNYCNPDDIPECDQYF